MQNKKISPANDDEIAVPKGGNTDKGVSEVIKEGKFGPGEAIAMIAIFISTKVFLSLPQSMARLGDSAGWLVLLVAGSIGFLGFSLLVLLLRRFPDKTLIEATQDVVGPVLAPLFSFPYFAFFLVDTALLLRQFSETMLLTALPEMPVSIVALAFLLVIVFVCYLGLETVARLAFIAFPFLLVGPLIVILTLITYWNFDYLFPLAGSGFPGILKGGFFSHSVVAEVLFLGVIQTAVPGRRLFRIGTLAIVFSIAFLTAIQLTYSLTFIPEVTKEYILPVYQLTRLVYLGRFFQRVEVLFLLIWTISGLIAMTLGLYAATVTITRILQLPKYRPLLFSMSVILYTLALIPPDLPTTLLIQNFYFRIYAGIPAFAIPALLYIIAVIRAKGGLPNEQ